MNRIIYICLHSYVCSYGKFELHGASNWSSTLQPFIIRVKICNLCLENSNPIKECWLGWHRLRPTWLILQQTDQNPTHILSFNFENTHLIGWIIRIILDRFFSYWISRYQRDTSSKQTFISNIKYTCQIYKFDNLDLVYFHLSK